MGWKKHIQALVAHGGTAALPRKIVAGSPEYMLYTFNDSVMIHLELALQYKINS